MSKEIKKENGKKKIFPFDYSRKELIKFIGDRSYNIIDKSADTVNKNGPSINLAVYELQRRQSRNIGYLSLFIAIIALLISIFG